MKNYPKCIDCGTKTGDYESKRCWECYIKYQQIPEHTPNYKDGKSLKKERKYGTMEDRNNSGEYRKNLSNSLIGHIPWNKGLTGVQQSTRKGICTKPKHFCFDCKKELPYNVPSLRCYSCASKYRMLLIDFSGDNNPNWKDGRTNKWKKVRKQCFERDNYTCNLCNKRGTVYLNAHHIINRHECKDKFDLNNLVSLCKSCHLSMTNIEQTDSYNEYKEIFNLYIQKINLKGENHECHTCVQRE